MRSRWMKTSARYAWNGCMKPSITTMCSVGARNSWKNWRRQLNKIDEVPVDRIGPRKNLGLVFSIRRPKRTDSIIVLVDHRQFPVSHQGHALGFIVWVVRKYFQQVNQQLLRYGFYSGRTQFGLTERFQGFSVYQLPVFPVVRIGNVTGSGNIDPVNMLLPGRVGGCAGHFPVVLQNQEGGIAHCTELADSRIGFQQGIKVLGAFTRLEVDDQQAGIV